jgi:hypothetical protein
MVFAGWKTILHVIFIFNAHLSYSENADWVEAKKRLMTEE